MHKNISVTPSANCCHLSIIVVYHNILSCSHLLHVFFPDLPYVVNKIIIAVTNLGQKVAVTTQERNSCPKRCDII